MLIPFDPVLPVQLACDAIPQGVAVARILFHIINGQEAPLHLLRRLLTQAEQNNSQLDREVLEVLSVEHFHQYVFARPLKLITDNQFLVRIFHQNLLLASQF